MQLQTQITTEIPRYIEGREIAWAPHPGQQWKFSAATEFEVLYGGAAGGGKTDCLIMEAIRYIWHPGYKGIILRKTFSQLEEIIDRTRECYDDLGGEYLSGEHRWYFPSGAIIKLGHMADKASHYNYLGHQYQFVGYDEASMFAPEQYLYLFSRCRSIYPEIPARFRAATNPGGPGHVFLKNRFRIGTVAPETRIYDPKSVGEDGRPLFRKYIPAKIQDNPTLFKNDPDYVKRLMLLPEIERLRLLDGEWDAFEGQAFTELNRDIHGMDPFDLPPEWRYYRSFDWGYSKPWCCIFWAHDYDGRLYIVKILYGAKKDENGDILDVGLKMTDTEIARAIKKAEMDLKVKVSPGPACKSTFARKRPKNKVVGPAPAEEMAREGLVWIEGDHDRIPGKRQFHQRLRLDDEGNPHMYIFNDCKSFWDFVPLIYQDPKKIEDVAEDQPHDHIYEAVRLGLMFKPMRPRVIPSGPPPGSMRYEREKYQKARKFAKRHGISLADAYQRRR
jgi:hypothetical protein